MYYHSTEAGIALAMAHQPKITAAGARSKERYKKFLFLRDIMPNLSFREFVPALLQRVVVVIMTLIRSGNKI